MNRDVKITPNSEITPLMNRRNVYRYVDNEEHRTMRGSNRPPGDGTSSLKVLADVTSITDMPGERGDWMSVSVSLAKGGMADRF